MITFQIGDRVRFIDPPKGELQMHGVVVKYKGKHYPDEPRVRWNSGWGTSEPVRLLCHLTDEDKAKWPTPPSLMQIDLIP